jgi:hypothetical protein
MSTSEPFLPAGEAPRDADPRDLDIDADVDSDVLAEPGVDDPDARAAESAANTTFRTPEPGKRLSPEELARELDSDS